MERAFGLFDNALESFQRASDQASIATTLAELAVVFTRTEQSEIAATLYGISTHHGRGMAIGLPEALDLLRSDPGEPAFDEFVANGDVMPFRDALRYARHHVLDALRQLASQPS